MDVYAQFGGAQCSGEAMQTQPCVPQKSCPLETGCGDRFRCTSGTLRHHISRNTCRYLFRHSERKNLFWWIQVSASASPWCVTETRTVRTVSMREAVLITATTRATLKGHLPTLSTQAEGESLRLSSVTSAMCLYQTKVMNSGLLCLQVRRAHRQTESRGDQHHCLWWSVQEGVQW